MFALALLALGKEPDIVSEVRAAYAALKTYADEGVIETPELSEARREFHTAYVRPNRLRFTFHDHSDENIFGKDQRWEIWPHEGGHVLWTTCSKGLVQGGPLRELIQKPMANQVVDLAIKLLVPGVHFGPPALDSFRKAHVSGQEIVDGASCVVLTSEEFDATLTLWIDAKTHLIRRYRWFTDYSRSRKLKGQEDWADETTTVTLRPQANPALDAKAMTFSPPKGVVWSKDDANGAPDEP